MDKYTVIAKETQRAAGKLEHRENFIARNYWLWVAVAFVFYPLSSIFSALTEGGHVLIRMKATMGDGLAPMIVTILLVALIEGLKFFLGKGAIDDIQAGVFSEGGAYLYAFVLKALGFIAIIAYSITLSVKGAPEINEYLRTQVKLVQPEYISLDSINSRYDAEILPYQGNIDKYSQTTWKGKIVSEARQMIMAEQKNIDRIEERRNTELNRAILENDKIGQDFEERTASNGQWAMGFAGLGEVICIFCLIFIGIYDDGIYTEATKQQQGAPTPSGRGIGFSGQRPASNYTQVPSNQQTPNYYGNHRNPIGFRLRNTEESYLPPGTGENKTVATGSYRPATDDVEVMSDELKLKIETLIQAYRRCRSDYQAWAAKLAGGKGRPATNRRHMAAKEEEMTELSIQLEELGVNIHDIVKPRS